jgi:very-short-patch-repair endonuclease
MLLQIKYRIPYNPKLKERAKMLRKNMTQAEKIFWNKILKTKVNFPFRFLRQRPIDNYIVDFYCPALKLIIEIDGGIHEQQGEYDEERTNILEAYGLTVIRYKNNDIINNTEMIKEHLSQILSGVIGSP